MSNSGEKLRPLPPSPSPLSTQELVLPQHVIVESTWGLPKGQRHEKRERGDHKIQSENWDGEYKHVYPC